MPLYVEAEWEWHHHLPQRWWNPERKEPYPFSEKAIKYFDSQIVRVPRGEHWGRLHNTYNKVVGALLGTYLNQEAEKAGKTLKKYLSDMGAEDAAACLEEIKWIIRNSGPDASDEVKDAKTFLEKMESYEPKEPNR